MAEKWRRNPQCHSRTHCHSRESGNPSLNTKTAAILTWIPVCTGMTLRLWMTSRLVMAFVILVMLPLSVAALEPQERLADPALEARAREISAELRCLVCQNQSIDDSDATLAKDLRIVVRQRLATGDSNAQVFDYVVARYGEFVLLRPRFNRNTLLLWLAPALMLGGGLLLASRVMRKPAVQPAATPPLTTQEQADLNAIYKTEQKDRTHS